MINLALIYLYKYSIKSQPETKSSTDFHNLVFRWFCTHLLPFFFGWNNLNREEFVFSFCRGLAQHCILFTHTNTGILRRRFLSSIKPSDVNRDDSGVRAEIFQIIARSFADALSKEIKRDDLWIYYMVPKLWTNYWKNCSAFGVMLTSKI